MDILRRDKLQINAVDLGAFGNIMAHLRRCNDVIQLIFRVQRQLRCAGTLAGKLPSGYLCTPPCVGLPHLLYDLKQPRTPRYTVCLQGRRNRQTDGLLCAGGIRHHQIGGKGIQTALYTFYRREKGFQINGKIGFFLQVCSPLSLKNTTKRCKQYSILGGLCQFRV